MCIRDRNNTECKTNERVFDYADKLSDSEEETLRGEIAELEDKVGMDFVVVTMDQYTDLSEYDADAVSYDIESNTKDIAEKICDYYRFGWEEWPAGTYLDGRDASTSVVKLPTGRRTTDMFICAQPARRRRE